MGGSLSKSTKKNATPSTRNVAHIYENEDTSRITHPNNRLLYPSTRSIVRTPNAASWTSAMRTANTVRLTPIASSNVTATLSNAVKLTQVNLRPQGMSPYTTIAAPLTVRLPSAPVLSPQAPAVHNFCFKALAYPHVSIRDGGVVAERIAANQPNYVYATKGMKRGDVLAFEVDKAENGTFEWSFVFGVTTCSPDRVENNEYTHLRDFCRYKTCGGNAFTFRIYKANAIGDKITFERRDDGCVYFRVNHGREILIRMGERRAGTFKSQTELTPFIQLNGFVSKIKFANDPIPLNRTLACSATRRQPNNLDNSPARGATSGYTTICTGHESAAPLNSSFPAVDWTTSSNVAVVDSYEILLMDSGYGRVLNKKPLRPQNLLTFKIRAVDGTRKPGTLSLAFVEPSNPLFQHETLDSEIPPGALVKLADDIVERPVTSHVFTIYRKANGEVTVRCEGKLRILFKVHPTKNFWPMMVFSGSVTSIELMPNESHNRNSRQADGDRQKRRNKRDASHGERIWTRTSNTVADSSPSAVVKFEADSGLAQSPKECTICMENTVDCAIIPCGHQKTCMACAQKIMTQGDRRCPFCRDEIQSLLKVYPD